MVDMMMNYPVRSPNMPDPTLAKAEPLSGIPPKERGSQNPVRRCVAKNELRSEPPSAYTKRIPYWPSLGGERIPHEMMCPIQKVTSNRLPTSPFEPE
jgi:hypothetical protein